MNARIVHDMPYADYSANPAVSYSGLKRLLRSPLDFWIYSRHNPNCPKEDVKEHFEFGNALHCRILEGADTFNRRFCRSLERSDYPDHAKSGAELTALCLEMGLPKSGTIPDQTARILKADPNAKVWSIVEEQHKQRFGNRTPVSANSLAKIEYFAQQLEAAESTRKLLAGGQPEVSIFWTDDETGVPLKARLDMVNGPNIVDLKTFTNPKQMAVEQAVAHAVATYRYGMQAVMYCEALKQAEAVKPKFTFIFLESGFVPNIVVRELGEFSGGERSAYWGKCQRDLRTAIRTYQLCVEHWGYDQPWSERVTAGEFFDEDFPSYAL